MSDQKGKNEFDVPLADHEYDGIQELNNPAPFWWQLFFYLSIAFAIGYYVYNEWGTAPSSTARLNQEMAEIGKLQAKNAFMVPPDSEFQALASQIDAKDHGRKVFQTNCASCHAPDGGGLIGPNLTDQYWIHGKGTYGDLFQVISAGVPDKGMPAWGALLSKDDLLKVIAHVKSLGGTKPLVAKAPQGNEIKN